MTALNTDADSNDRHVLSGTVDALLVDDDETWARTQRRVLERYYDAVSVSTAHTLQDALYALETGSPDCLICDYQLGDGTGLEFLEAVRRDHPKLPFVLVTGQGDESVASEAIRERVTDYVRKDDLASQPDLLATRLTSVVEAYRTEQALEREQRSKDALRRLVTASTNRQELGRGVCRHFVDEQRYAFAWIGVLDRNGAVVPFATAGDNSYLEAVLEPGTKPGHGTEPAVTALARGDTVVESLIDSASEPPESVNAESRAEDADYEPDSSEGIDGAQSIAQWRQAALEHGIGSAMAVPIEYDDVQFGVLAVYDNGVAFDSQARELLSEYAETVGYAFQATEWRRALFSSTATSLEITVADEFSPLVALSRELARTVTIEVGTVIPRNDDEVLYLASISGASASSIEDAGEAVASVRSVEVYETGDPVRCGLVVETPVPETVLVEVGSRFRRTVVADGQMRISASVRATEAVRPVIDRLEDAFADASVTTVWSDHSQPEDPDGGGLERLTDRQRQVLELALNAGYFERPRRHNTGELAAMLDISRATFTQHLRVAQSKVFEELVSV
ncbi:bacterio-opsin activator domain-containing protein [Natronorubrum tibetense]|uniref:Response regulator receiver protein n=1 Tax=Natronorubrum tibetense GA33 TaxID=1114856 RepID=L9VPX3_9EURY|nr:bacterio-opsin activator domain-containing protein [Natronorubrum tibetense]ELY39007.1 response regulator receiver protein [Natronorubrum tibetense GA33]